jgi:hypothetical protein
MAEFQKRNWPSGAMRKSMLFLPRLRTCLPRGPVSAVCQQIKPGSSELAVLNLVFCTCSFVGDTVIQVLVLRKIFSAMPQQFMLVLKDPMKPQNTKFGAEDDVRTILKAVGIPQPEIERLFEQAKSNTDPPFTARH